MPYAGYRRAGGVAPTQDQGNPFYDQYSPTPNYGAGIASLLQNLWQMDAMKKQQEAEAAQQAFENQMKMGDFDLQRAQAEALRGKTSMAAEPQLGPADFEAVMQTPWDSIPPAQKPAAIQAYLRKKTEAPKAPPKTEEQELGLYEKKQAIAAKYRPSPTAKVNPQVKGAEAYASNLEKVYTKAIEDIQKQSQGSASARSMAALLGKPMAEDTSPSEVTNLESGLSEIRRIQSILAGGTVPEATDMELLKRLGTDIQSIRKGGLKGGAAQPAAPVDDIESNPEFQAYVAAHPEEPKGRVRAMFKRYLATQKR